MFSNECLFLSIGQVIDLFSSIFMPQVLQMECPQGRTNGR